LLVLMFLLIAGSFATSSNPALADVHDACAGDVDLELHLKSQVNDLGKKHFCGAGF
jgi:hypothetical protein